MKVYTVGATVWLGSQPIYKVQGPYEAHWVKIGGDRLFMVKLPRMNLDRSKREESWTPCPRKDVYTSKRGARIAMGRLNAKAQRASRPEDQIRTARVTLIDKKNGKTIGQYDMGVDNKTDRITKFDKVGVEKERSPISCNHANECPAQCPCDNDCYCRNEGNCKPSPGSDAAIKKGCKCPVLDNAHGKGCGYGPNTFWINEGCPLHAKKDEKPWGTGAGNCLCYQDERSPDCPVHNKKEQNV